jgi:hypothetical protein
LIRSSSITDRLIDSDPFDWSDANRALFVESFRETALIHYEGNAVFRAFWQDAGLHPREVTSEEALLRVPPLMVHLFKERELVTGDRDAIALRLTSSGTGGQKSQQFLSARSLERVKRLAYSVHRALGLTSAAEVNYVCFTYDPRVAADLGTAFTDELLTSFTGKREVYYTFQWDEARGDFTFNEQGTVDALKRFASMGKPVRILGFPAFLHRILKAHDLKLALGPESFVQTGGGWKSLAGEELPKAEFRAFVSERLGIPLANVRDLFGMVEHGIPYVDCEKGALHIPNLARVSTRSPDGRRVLPEGSPGLLQLLCTYNDSYPAMSLLTTDWGRVGECDCRIGGPTLELLGRAGVTRHKGCAVKAAEML